MKRFRRLRGKWLYEILDCRHAWKDDDGVERPLLGTTGSGVVCSDCGMLLTWDELAEYMRGERD